MKNRREKGKYGENLALNFLKKKGYQIITQNYYTPYGEIDIIAKNTNDLIFIEVKLRNSESFGHVLEQLSVKKLKSMLESVKYYLSKKTLKNENIRFDYIALSYNKKKYEINHIKHVIEI